MKGKFNILALTATLVLALDLVIESGLSESWARQGGGKQQTSGIAQSGGNTQASSQSLSQGSNVQGSVDVSSSTARGKKKKSSGDQQQYLQYEMKDALITGF
jgi:hypothetical protein